MANLRIVCDGCGSVYYVPEATACRLPCENCGLKLDCHGGEYRSPAKDVSGEVSDEEWEASNSFPWQQ